ncbi:MAG: PqqD family protein [Thermoguttaceae bacterium]
MRNKRMLAAAEPQGTLLVTEDGQGVKAVLGGRLNPVAREIWTLANGKHSVEDIASSISRRFVIPYDVALDDTRAFIDVMVEHSFISTEA